ncbi:MAG: Cyclopropane-fatty-acyl-phospholipid synthase [Syntrophorhabdaceae bacterium PtaU1.Bin034]|nr:MAG: Cyclopropane-fatty-acyl-phospholipid synthase [Syntrophorhabdaceae bacterium PtaU1.Bin034]
MKKALQELLRTVSLRLPEVPFEVLFWDGDREAFGNGKPVFTLTFTTRKAARAILGRGATGFREEYVAGTIDVSGDLRQLLRAGMDPLVQNMKVSFKTKLLILLQHLRSLNTPRRAPVNIAYHYELGDDFFRHYLDKSLTYSCAYFRNRDDTLERAQEQKYEHICRKLNLREGESLVDIGCGWGGMLLYAARHYKVRCVGCTLSRNQAEYARKRAVQEGLEKTITVIRKDYRNVTGKFDKLVSIGMFEHVGKGYAPTFMKKMRDLLRPGGVGLLHTVGKERNAPADPWTTKYIFPGTHIPILDHVIRFMGKSGLVPTDIENLRLHYASTLEEWGRRFEANASIIEKMFDARFVRTWRMYLNGSEAAFRYGNLRLYQIAFTNGLNNELPMTRDSLYLN